MKKTRNSSEGIVQELNSYLSEIDDKIRALNHERSKIEKAIETSKYLLVLEKDAGKSEVTDNILRQLFGRV